eukprot:6018371-Alexandrium_andersonii.AAC.1
MVTNKFETAGVLIVVLEQSGHRTAEALGVGLGRLQEAIPSKADLRMWAMSHGCTALAPSTQPLWNQ